MWLIYAFITVVVLLVDFYCHAYPELGSSVTIVLLMIVLYRLHKLSDLLQNKNEDD